MELVLTQRKKKCITIADGKEAIKTAVSLSGNEDIILVAGKDREIPGNQWRQTRF